MIYSLFYIFFIFIMKLSFLPPGFSCKDFHVILMIFLYFIFHCYVSNFNKE